MTIKNETVLITGGAGFIGSHLAHSLRHDYHVISLDNYSNGSEENHIDGVKYINADTAQCYQLEIYQPSIIFHFGEYARVEQSITDIEKVIKSNVIGTSQVLEYWRKKRCKLIYAGSSTKFGDGGRSIQDTPYAWTKAKNTEIIKAYSDWYKLPYAIVYFYNVYGEREVAEGPYATIVAKFLQRYHDGLPLEVTLPGTQERNFTYIGDTISALKLIADKGSGDEYGIGAPESYSLIDLAKMISDDIRFIPARKGNRNSAELKIQKTEALGWKTKMKLKTYIEKNKL